jgi:hypothetical protein
MTPSASENLYRQRGVPAAPSERPYQERLINFVVSILQSGQQNSTSSMVVMNMVGVIVLIFIGASHRMQSGGVGMPRRVCGVP